MGIVLGITGGIASGKTTISEMFQECGAKVVSADEIARQVLEPGSPALNELVRAFGTSILSTDGVIDRKALAGIVFADVEALAVLNKITHPVIIAELERKIAEFRSSSVEDDVLVVEIPLLVECDLSYLVDKVVVVVAEQHTQIIRLTTRGISTDEAVQRISSQMPIEEKLPLADWIIRTDTSLEDTRRQVEEIWNQVGEPRGTGNS